jgi:uncharacterized protein (TIGR03083 family)
MDAWQRVAAHRNRIADLLDTLSAEQLATPSLCEGWTVHQVAGHLTSGWNIGLAKFGLGVLKKRGNSKAPSTNSDGTNSVRVDTPRATSVRLQLSGPTPPP